MKKLLAVGLLFSFLSSTTELHELLKVPHLISHFVEHYSHSSEKSFIDYLQKHYAHEQDGSQDEHHDQGCLPFQGNHPCQNFTYSGVYFEPSPHEDGALPIQSTLKHYSATESFKSDYCSNIWQPPKIG